MEFLSELGLFTAKLILIAGAVLILIAFAMQSSNRGRQRAQLEIEKLNRRFRSYRRQLQGHVLNKKEFKSLLKGEKKARKSEEQKPSRLFVVDFDGDIRASGVESLREEVTAILSVAKPGDEVVVRLDSGGGLVTHYGLAASQLMRFKSHQVRLTVCVDKIAASGGYMMACVADRILAAPFAVVGSIGVVAQVPNIHKLLRRHDIDYREITAGEYKRTISVFGEITEPGMEKFKSQIEETHVLFKTFVNSHRPALKIEQVATGEHWYGTQAVDLGLVDEIRTSDDYLFDRYESADIYRVQYHGKKRWADRLSDSLTRTTHGLLRRVWSDLDRSRFNS